MIPLTCYCGLELTPQRYALSVTCECGAVWVDRARAGCEVLGCRRTFKRNVGDDGTAVYICGEHYRMADRSIRQLRTKLRRRAQRHGWSPRLERIDRWLWDRALKQATERTMGI